MLFSYSLNIAVSTRVIRTSQPFYSRSENALAKKQWVGGRGSRICTFSLKKKSNSSSQGQNLYREFYSLMFCNTRWPSKCLIPQRIILCSLFQDNIVQVILGWLGIQSCQEIFKTIYLSLNLYIYQQSPKCKNGICYHRCKADIKISIWWHRVKWNRTKIVFLDVSDVIFDFSWQK